MLRRIRSRRVALLLLGAAFIPLCLLAHQRVTASLVEYSRFQIELDTGSPLAPHWALEASATPVGIPLERGGRQSLLDEDLTKKVAELYRAHPWVAEVLEVRRDAGKGVTARIRFRHPVVAVSSRHGYLLLDRYGARLPGVYPDLPALTPRAVPVLGVEGRPPPAGERWLVPEVQAGLRVAEQLEQLGVHELVEVEALEVAGAAREAPANRSPVLLRLGGGCLIEWGQADGTVSAREKVLRLRLTLAAAPGLRGVERALLQFDRPYLRYCERE